MRLAHARSRILVIGGYLTHACIQFGGDLIEQQPVWVGHRILQVMFKIRISRDAERHLKGLSARSRGIKQLQHEPQGVEELRPNPLAAWELRVQAFRVLYNVDEENENVFVVAIGVNETSS